MILNLIQIQVKPECLPDFIEGTLANHHGTRKEKGNLRFDVVQKADQPESFLLYEIFEDEAAIEFHRTTEHYKEWKSKAEAWMAAPRIATRYQILAPTPPQIP
jgi:autoinducer 2-degrading protein